MNYLPEKKYTLKELAEELSTGKLSSVELCERCLNRVDEIDDKLNAFLDIDKKKILLVAKASDKRRASNSLLSLYDGIPVAIKANMSVKEESCNCGSQILEGYTASYDAGVIKKLKNAGMIPFGRTNMDEFGMGSSSENSSFGNTLNPHHSDHVPGGSSSGSAAAVASAEVPVALGSDTGGSVRQPASFCGIVGFKPTYGRVSRSGLVAFASSLDQIGPLTNNVEDAAIMLDIIGGHDSDDSTSLPLECCDFADSLKNTPNPKTLRIGIPHEYMHKNGLDDEIYEKTMQLVNKLRDAGAQIVNVSLPHTKYSVATYYVIATAEASANLQRFDGIRYGARDMNCEDLLETYMSTREKGFGEEVKRRIILGTFVLSSGYYDAYYLRAQKVRTLIKNDFKKIFEKCDVILSPVSPSVAWKFGDKTADPLQMYLSDIFILSSNLAGNCAISIPNGKNTAGMPIGLQLTGPELGEKELLQVAYLLEKKLKNR
ncbi:MAG: Asp-tRNA(Asn)/Glu-tRNA(Gln) amidotransferase subunit GatA [Verrucomicrobiota bacterium]|nr:Asp-tRNA(Asn)/Glu-tRNA(Gln) amidotransferase subunit GatA [Verrucomicrobiota bacterium]